MNGVRYVVALVESPDPLVKPVITDRIVWAAAWGIAHNRTSLTANKSQQSETPYRLSIAFNINFGPLAPGDLDSLSMKSGDFRC
jgi:hypothetical protein